MRLIYRPTPIEFLVLLAVLGALVAIWLPDSATRTQRNLESRAANWMPSRPIVSPDSTLLAQDFDLEGEWERHSRLEGSSLVFSRRADGTFAVAFRTQGCLGGCTLDRIATLTDGQIRLNGAVSEYVPITYDTLFAVRIDGEDYLLPAPRVADFERERTAGSDVWRWRVFARKTTDDRPDNADR